MPYLSTVEECLCTRVEEGLAKKVCAMVLGLHSRVIEQRGGPASCGQGFPLAIVCLPSQCAHLVRGVLLSFLYWEQLR